MSEKLDAWVRSEPAAESWCPFPGLLLGTVLAFTAGQKGSRAQPGSLAFESKTKRGASCRVPRRLSLCIPSRGKALGRAPLRQPAPPGSAFPGLGWRLEEILQSYHVGFRGINFTELYTERIS